MPIKIKTLTVGRLAQKCQYKPKLSVLVDLDRKGHEKMSDVHRKAYMAFNCFNFHVLNKTVRPFTTRRKHFWL